MNNNNTRISKLSEQIQPELKNEEKIERNLKRTDDMISKLIEIITIDEEIARLQKEIHYQHHHRYEEIKQLSTKYINYINNRSEKIRHLTARRAALKATIRRELNK